MRKLIKKILNESSELEWIKNVKSNQDIAQEIADESEIKKDDFNLRIDYTPPSPVFSSPPPLPFFPPISSPLHTFLQNIVKNNMVYQKVI